MIRSNVPLPFLYRLRLRAGSAARRAAAPAASHPARSAARRASGGGAAAQVWLHFIDQYELFTEVLCAAAKSGCDTRRETEYARLRCWFMANYYRTAARVRPVLEEEFGAEACSPSITDYAGQKRTLDALEALFLPPTLREVLKHDTGDLIPRVARVSDVIYRCHAEWEESQAA